MIFKWSLLIVYLKNKTFPVLLFSNSAFQGPDRDKWDEMYASHKTVVLRQDASMNKYKKWGLQSICYDLVVPRVNVFSSSAAKCDTRRLMLFKKKQKTTWCRFTVWKQVKEKTNPTLLKELQLFVGSKKNWVYTHYFLLFLFYHKSLVLVWSK